MPQRDAPERPATQRISSARNGDGRLEVFGSDDGLHHMWQTKPSAGPWSAWSRLT